MLEDIILTSKYPSTFIEPLICSISNGRMWGSTYIDLRNVSEDNPVVVPIVNQHDARLTPLCNTAIKRFAYVIQLSDDTITTIRFIRSSNIYCKVALIFRRNLHTVRVHQYHSFRLSKIEKLRKNIVRRANKLTVFFKNRYKICDYIDKIALFPLSEVGNNEFSIMDLRYNKGATSLSYYIERSFKNKITVLNAQIVRILDYVDIIENLDNITLEEQYEFARFIKRNLPDSCQHRNITITYKSGLAVIKFCGIILAVLNKDWPPDTYFKYCRHRGMSFLARILTRSELMGIITKQTIKRQNLQI